MENDFMCIFCQENELKVEHKIFCWKKLMERVEVKFSTLWNARLMSFERLERLSGLLKTWQALKISAGFEKLGKLWNT